jgi:hypothetical protein
MADVMQHFARVAITTQGMNTGGQTRQDFEEEIVKRAPQVPGLTQEQIFTRYVTTDATGRLLFKASVMAAPRQAAQDLPVTQKPPSAGEASDELNELPRAMAKEKNLKFEQAFSALWTDPERAELVARVRREEAEQRARVQYSRWPIRAAEQEFSRDWRLGRSAGSRRM